MEKKITAINQTNKQEKVDLRFRRVIKLLPDSETTKEVSGILNDQVFIDGLSDKQLLLTARCAIEHGLIEKGLELYNKLNLVYPKIKEGWTEHAEVLEFLNKSKDLLALRFRAIKLLGKKEASSLLPSFSPPKRLQSSRSDAEDFSDSQKEKESQVVIDDLSPFEENITRIQNIKQFMILFRGRDDVFARQWVDKTKGISGYAPVKRPINAADIEEHLKGNKTYGIYLMNPDNTVWTGVTDIDLKKEYRITGGLKGLAGAVKQEIKFILSYIVDQAQKADLSPIAEFSGGKGYHLWFPVTKPVAASDMRCALSALCNNIANKTEFFQIEIFPKQDVLSGKGLGNLVKLPLGIHRLTGKRSFLVLTGTRDKDKQLAILASMEPSSPKAIKRLAAEAQKAQVVLHPATSDLEKRFPQLMELQRGCRVISQLANSCLAGRDPGEKGRKILLSTVGFLEKGRHILHHLFSKTPDYNRPLLDYEISRLRGTPLGCKRIHSLYGLGDGGLDCAFQLEKGQYAHPLLHIQNWPGKEVESPKAERIENLNDALINLKTAVEIVERFL